MMRSRKSRILRGLALSFATLLVVLLAAEGILRLCGYADNPAIYFDPQVGLRYFPNQNRQMLRPDGSVLGGFATNEHGFRTPSFEIEKPPGVTRIVCLGDSFTLGWGVDGSETWPRQLQDLCDAAGGRGRVEVINLGQPDFNTVNEERLYRSFARRLKADLVLLAYVLNDMAPETLGPVDVTSKIDQVIGTTAIMRALRRHFFHSWGVYQYANNPENTRKRKLYGEHIGAILAEPDGELARPYWDVSMEALRGLARAVTEDGSRFVLVSFPDSGQVASVHQTLDANGAPDPNAMRSQSPSQDRLRRECQGLGVPVIDLLEDFSRTGPVLYGDIDGSHPAGLGMRVAARRIHQWLAEHGLVGGGQDPAVPIPDRRPGER